MSEKNITFEDMPKAMSWMMDKLNELDSKIDGLNNSPQTAPSEIWMNLKELREYLPSHPAEQTVYGWTSCHQMTINGKTNKFTIEDFEHCAKIASLRTKDVKQAFSEVYDAISKWQFFADSVGVRPEKSYSIKNCFVNINTL